MKLRNKQIYSIAILIILALFSGCTKITPTKVEEVLPSPIPTPVPTPVKLDDEAFDKNLEDQFAGLEGVDLYNAVIIPKYTGTYSYKMETHNQFDESTIQKYYSNGSYNESYTRYNDTYITIFDNDKHTVYTYSEDYEYCYYVEYEMLENGYYGCDEQPFNDEFYTLTESKIIDFNGRPTYYYERKFEEKDFNGNPLTFVNKFWIDLETKVQMQAEFYLNDEWQADSQVTEFNTDIEIDDTMFQVPDNKTLTDDEEYAMER